MEERACLGKYKLSKFIDLTHKTPLEEESLCLISLRLKPSLQNQYMNVQREIYLHLCYANAQSLVNKFDDFELLLHQESVDVGVGN